MRKWWTYLIEAFVCFGVFILLDLLFFERVDWVQAIVIPVVWVLVEVIVAKRKASGRK